MLDVSQRGRGYRLILWQSNDFVSLGQRSPRCEIVVFGVQKVWETHVKVPQSCLKTKQMGLAIQCNRELPRLIGEALPQRKSIERAK